MRKIILILLCMFLLVGTVSSVNYFYEKDEKVNQRIRCFDSSNNYCGSGTKCYASVEDPEGMTALNNVSLTFNETYFNITLPTNKTGEYSFIGACSSSNNMIMEFTYEVTLSGKSFTLQQSLLYFVVVGILILVFLLSLSGAIIIPYKNIRDEEEIIIGINHFKYAKLFCIYFSYLLFIWIMNLLVGLTNYYLDLGLSFSIFAFLLRFLMRTIFPVGVLIFVAVVILFWKDKATQDLINRGITLR